MSSKVFESRQKLLESPLQDFKAYLDKRQHDYNDYLNLLILAFKERRHSFIHYLQILCSHCKSLINAKITNQILLLQLCRGGVLGEVQVALRLGADIEVSNQNGNCLYNALLNEAKNQSFEIVKYLVNQQPKLIHISQKQSLVLKTIIKEQWKTAQFLLDKGISCNYINEQGQNLLHILMQHYSKKSQKEIIKIRDLLVERGVDEEKSTVNGRKPYQMCPPHVGKKFQEQVNMKRKSVEEANGDKQGLIINQKYKTIKNKSEENDKNYKDFFNMNSKPEAFPRVGENNRVVLKIDNKIDQLQIMKEADQILERFNQEKEKDLKKKKDEKAKNKVQAKNNKVFTSEELKYYLQQDIKYQTQLIQQTNNNQKQFFNKLIQQLKFKIKTQLGVEVQIFGSFATGLCLPQSDIDVVIIPREDHEEYSSFNLLQKIESLLSKMTEQIESIKFIKTASVPILKIQCTEKYIDKKIDITYQDQKHNGLQSVVLIQQYLQIYPQLRSLTFILKKFIYSARLFDPYSGGISSYGLILMIVAYIQNDNRERKVRSKVLPPPSVAELLIGFLKFYGFKMNYIAKQICVLQPERAKQEMQAKQLDMQRQPIYPTVMEMDLIYNNVFNSNTEDWQPRPRLVIKDPLNPQNNIGRATHKIRQIKTAFEMACVCIHTNKRCIDKKQCGSYKRIKYHATVDVRYEGNKRPCCIIKRMLRSTNIISMS